MSLKIKILYLILFIIFSIWIDFLSAYVWIGFFILIVSFLNDFGKKFLFHSLISLITWTQYLLGPLLLKTFNVRMYVSYNEYFAYAIPATILFILGLYLPLRFNRNSQDKFKVEEIKNLFKTYGNPGRILVLVGTPFWLLQPIVPAAISYVFSLFAFILVVGMCMLSFSNKKSNLYFFVFGFAVIASNTLFIGMVGPSVFWLIIILIYRFSYKPLNISFTFKLIGLLIAFYALMVIQSAKKEYRNTTWNIVKYQGGKEGDRKIQKDPELLLDLTKDRATKPLVLLQDRNVLNVIARLNQGYIVSQVMDYIPDKRDYGRGEITIKSTTTAFIPRIIYPNKPLVSAGDYYKEYTGIKLGKYHSATLGNLGDAYADYGRYGVIYLFFYGLLIGWLYKYFVSSNRNPMLYFWFSIIFFYTIAVNEVSVMKYLNSILKVMIFVYSVRFVMRKFRLNV